MWCNPTVKTARYSGGECSAQWEGFRIQKSTDLKTISTSIPFSIWYSETGNKTLDNMPLIERKEVLKKIIVKWIISYQIIFR